MTKITLFRQRLWYGIRTNYLWGAVGYFIALYFSILSLVRDEVSSYFSWFFLWLIIPACILFFPLIAVLWWRWLPSSMIIPTPVKDDNPINGKVKFSTSSIFDQTGDLILSYNKNNIVGGISISEGSANKVNLMAQFMHKYFGKNENDDPCYFNWDLFLECYFSDQTKVYCLFKDDLKLIDKMLVPLKSSYSDHIEKNIELNFREYGDAQYPHGVFPDGTVIALKLPDGADRNYVFLLCNTEYFSKNPENPKSSVDILDKCLSTVWRVIPQTPGAGARTVCLPFLGKGHSGLCAHAYSILWVIVFSYRKAFFLVGPFNFRINICIPVKDFTSSRMSLCEAARFLEYALRG